jgi:hypothetical protein
LQDIYLVTRLDGFTVQDAIALIDRATTALARRTVSSSTSARR